MPIATRPPPPATRSELLARALNGIAPHVDAPQDAPSAKIIDVSPAMAASWLADAHANRRISLPRVRQLTRAMESGRWELNGQPLIVSDQGKLLDGRHRLSAVVTANVTIPMLVVVGVDSSSLTIDSGRRRSGSDVLAISGQKQSQTLASALRWCWRYENQEMLQPSIPLEDYQLVDFLDHHKPMITSLTWGSLLKGMVPSGAGVMLHLFMAAKDPGLAKQFFTSLAQGVELTAADPVYQVRERFLHERKAVHHVSIVERLALVCRAWNCRRGTGRMPAGTWQGTSAQFPQIS